MPGRALVEPEDAVCSLLLVHFLLEFFATKSPRQEYPHVPTPKELELSRQLVELQQEKDLRETRALTQIRDLESQVHKLQVRVHDLSQMLQSTKRDQILAQQAAVEEERKRWKVTVQALQAELDQERNDKEAQKNWQCRFIAPVEVPEDVFASSSSPVPAPVIDSKEDVFSRFAQSLALLPASRHHRWLKLSAAVSSPLNDAEDGDVVTGSVLIALVHLAIYRTKSRSHQQSPTSHNGLDIREQIVKAGVCTPLVDILENSQNARVLVEASRLCAALASYVPNKRVLASKNVKRPFPWDPAVQQNMLSALVNLSHDCEILRSQIAATSNFLPIVVRYVRESPSADVQTEAAKLLGNMAYNHVVNQSALMAAEAPTALTACLTAANLQRSPQLARAGAVGLANLAYTSVNQLTIGYSNASTLLLQLLVDAVSQPTVIEAASTTLACLCHQNPPNKARVAAQNGLQVLLYALGATPDAEDDDDERGIGAALIALCESFAVIVNSRPNRQQVMELDGHFLLCQLCQNCSAVKTPKLLESSARAICALVPPPQERSALIADNRESKMETKSIALKALDRARHLLEQQCQRHLHRGEEEDAAIKGRCRWLTQTIDTLTSYQTSPASRQHSMSEKTQSNGEDSLTEFRDRSSLSLESLTAIPPDDLCPNFYDH
ncbi:Armadillo-type fold [Phytophthora cactorum]|nr:Armadillo-type fold [Phytophthora cactorum]